MRIIQALILNGPEKGNVIQVELNKLLVPSGYKYLCQAPGRRGTLTYEFQDFNINGKKFWAGSAMSMISMARALTIALESGVDTEEAIEAYTPINE